MEKVDCKLMMNVCCGIERNKGGVNHGLVIVDGNSEATGRRQWSCYGENGWERWNGFVMKGEQRQRELDRIGGSGVARDRGDDDGYRDGEGHCYSELLLETAEWMEVRGVEHGKLERGSIGFGNRNWDGQQEAEGDVWVKVFVDLGMGLEWSEAVVCCRDAIVGVGRGRRVR
ncbi:unnamed protein product [Vicia faba]|uniref:Uncharacterized protein n=1 Tax=Vicia faba TaxID=3906 RepID=A0AAV1B804_VICFA|nr:unnamed protein product [Vicia faba]